MDAPKIPHKEGLVARNTQADVNGFIPKTPLPVASAASLGQLLNEYAFFTPAMLYLYTNFRDDPLIDFEYSMGEPVRFYYHKFQRVIFRGLEARSNGNPDWNYVLWAVERPFWPALSDFLVSVVLTDADEQSVYGVGEQTFAMLDPLAAERTIIYSNGLPVIPVTAFGVNGNHCRVALVQGRTLLEPPLLRLFPGDPSMQVYANALYRGDNPVNARELELKRLAALEEKS